LNKLKEIQLKELECGVIVYNKGYKFIMSSQEREYLSMVLTSLFKYWAEDAGRRQFTIGRDRLMRYINDCMPQTGARKPCGFVGLKNAMHHMSPVFIQVHTRFFPDNGKFQRLYRTTPLLCEWFRRKSGAD
jgi:hypothetical protein